MPTGFSSVGILLFGTPTRAENTPCWVKLAKVASEACGSTRVSSTSPEPRHLFQVAGLFLSWERMRLACWRRRPRLRELSLHFPIVLRIRPKVRRKSKRLRAVKFTRSNQNLTQARLVERSYRHRARASSQRDLFQWHRRWYPRGVQRLHRYDQRHAQFLRRAFQPRSRID